MAIRIKMRCPLCEMTHFTGNIEEPLKLELDGINLPEIVLVKVTSKGRGKIQNHMTPLQDMTGSNSRADEIEEEILDHMRDRAENLVKLLSVRLSEL